MADDPEDDRGSLVFRPRDEFDIFKLQHPRFLEEFLDQPLTYIAESVMGALETGTRGLTMAGGRIVQALLKARLFQQWNEEFRTLRELGRLKEDFADTKYGFQTWVELMTIIDEESPDPDRLESLKSMFYAVNKVNADDSARIQSYQLWRLAKEMNSGDLLVLKVAYENLNRTANADWGAWMDHVAKLSGLGYRELVERHEKRLIEMAMLTPRFRVTGDGPGIESGIQKNNNRLTEAGVRFCQNIQTFRIDLQAAKEATKR